MLKIVALGASSAIVQATLRLFAKDGASLFVVSRSEAQNRVVKSDLISRGASGVITFERDLSEKDCAEEIFKEAKEKMGEIDLLIVGYGTLPDQGENQGSVTLTEATLVNNFLSVASHLTVWSNYFEGLKRGQIVVISSVAGDRGRKSNYVYGSAKAGLSAFLSGLRNRLCSSNVGVLTVIPGFVDTPMTKDLKKGLLFVSPDKVAGDIYRAIGAKRDVIYTPWFWRFIMIVIKAIPESIFKRLSI